MNKFTDNFGSNFSVCAKTSLVLVLLFGSFAIILAQSNWTSYSIGSSTKSLKSVISTIPGHPGATCFAVGDSGTILSNSNNNIWTKKQSGTTNDLLALLGSGNQMVAVGKTGTIISTLLGGPWHSQIPITTMTLRALAWGGSFPYIYISVGDSGLIITSPDDSTWTTGVSGTTKRLRSVYFPLGEGSQGSFTSVGDSGTILTSPDGIVWNNQTSGTTRNLNAVTRGVVNGGEKTVAVGDSGIILTSPDGKTWSSQTSGTTNTLWAIYSAEDQLNGNWILYVAVGERGTILTSSNGINWSPQISGTTRNLYGVTWGYDSLVVVGDSGTILTSYFHPAYSKIKHYEIPRKIINKIEIRKSSAGFFISLSGLFENSYSLSLAIFNITGQQVAHFSGIKSNHIFFNLSDLNCAKGLYIIRADLPDRTVLTQPFLFTK